MQEVIRSESRGQANHGWLQAKHTFSFAEYYDPERVQFGPLRVINEDRIAGGKGFGTHPHRDMEIITYPISGAIEHKDSMGNGTVIRAGDVQRMTAGTGILHSEFNHHADEELHLLQIWLLPLQTGLEPGYEQTTISRDDKLNQLRLIASGDGRNDSITVHQEVDIYASVLNAQKSVTHATSMERKLYIQLIQGELQVAGDTLLAGDGLKLLGTQSLTIKSLDEAEFLLFDMR